MIFSNNHSVISNKLYQENRWITLPETKINYKSVRSDTGLSSPSSGSSSSSSWSDHWVSRTRLLAALLTNCEKKARTELALGSQHWLSHSHRVVWSTVCLDHVLISLSSLFPRSIFVTSASVFNSAVVTVDTGPGPPPHPGWHLRSNCRLFVSALVSNIHYCDCFEQRFNVCNDEPLPPGSRVSFVFLMSLAPL